MMIRIGGRRLHTKRHTKTVASALHARIHAARMLTLPDVLAGSVHYYRSGSDRYTVAWNTVEGRAGSTARRGNVAPGPKAARASRGQKAPALCAPQSMVGSPATAA